MGTRSRTSKRPTDETPSREWRFDVLALAAVLTVGLLVRCWNLSAPTDLYFDEMFYVDAAVRLLTGQKDPNPAQPPVGKLMIAGSIRIWWWIELHLLGGHDSTRPCLAWRFGSLMCGLAMIVLVYFLGKSMFGRAVGGLAAFLLAIDFVHIVQSRIGMLDMYQSFFVLYALYCTWEYMEASSETELQWLLMGSVGLALAAATKWSSLFMVAGALPVVLVLKRSLGEGWRPRLHKLGKHVAIVLVILGTLYTATFLPRARSHHYSLSATLYDMYNSAAHMLRFRYSTGFVHQYKSAFWEWPTLLRPIWLYYNVSNDPECSILRHWFPPVQGAEIVPPPMVVGNQEIVPISIEHGWVKGIVDLGSPWVWWTFLLILASFLIRTFARLWARRRDDLLYLVGATHQERALALLAATYLSQVLMWCVNQGFLYYMLPSTPQMSLITAACIWEWRQRRHGKLLLGTYLAVAVITLILYWPLLVAYPIPARLFMKLIWLRPYWV